MAGISSTEVGLTAKRRPGEHVTEATDRLAVGDSLACEVAEPYPDGGRETLSERDPQERGVAVGGRGPD